MIVTVKIQHTLGKISNEDLHTLTIKDIVSPNSTTYLWTVGETIQGNTSGATAKIYSIEYTTAVRNEDE